jgi:hypothetical protein
VVVVVVVVVVGRTVLVVVVVVDVVVVVVGGGGVVGEPQAPWPAAKAPASSIAATAPRPILMQPESISADHPRS